MRTATAYFFSILCLTAHFAFASSLPASAGRLAAGTQAEGGRAFTSLTSEKGSFVIELTLAEKELRAGPNILDIVLRDGSGNGVQGAQLSIVPWMPAMGHGVWDKPRVRERGGGRYHVDNVAIIMSGVWELKVGVKAGAATDRAVFSFPVANEAFAEREPAKREQGYGRSWAAYQVPNLTLIDQDGKMVNLSALMESGKPVILDFIFTTCTTVCPVLSAGFANLRRELGRDAEKVQLVSITIDPENDRPETLKRYAQRFGAGPGWEFLTGSRDEVGSVLRAFDAFAADKMSHEPLYLMHAPHAAKWLRIEGIIGKSDLVGEYRKMRSADAGR